MESHICCSLSMNDDDLDELVSTIASTVGSLTNPTNLANAFRSEKKSGITRDTIAKYLEYMEDAFMIERSVRYDIRGKRYIDTPYKYYFGDVGLRNARIDFRQKDDGHLIKKSRISYPIQKARKMRIFDS